MRVRFPCSVSFRLEQEMRVTSASLERSAFAPPAAVRGPSRGHRADSEAPQGSPQFLGGGRPPKVSMSHCDDVWCVTG